MKTIFLFTLMVSISFATTINVPADVDSIQGAINMTVDGDTVLVQPGKYVESINFKGKNITVGSLTLITGDNSYIFQTIIDGSQPNNPDSGSVVYFISGEDTNSVLTGFTITGGSGTWINPRSSSTAQAHGGGIFIDNNSNPVLANLIVSGNVAESANGAGICCINNSNPRLEYVKVIENNGSGSAETNDGSGGILLNNSSPILKNVEIVNNIGIMSGGLYCSFNCYPVLINVTIAGNKAIGSNWLGEVAEVVCWEWGNILIINTIIWNDSLKEILLRDGSAITIVHSDIQDGRDSIVTFNDHTIHWLAGNIDSNPMFVNMASGDYRLLEGSPCIDAGIQDTMFVYNDDQDTLYIPPMDYIGSAPDMGAYEYGDPTKMKEKIELPKQYTLNQNYPNPFNPSTTIEFTLPKSEFVEMKVFNILGKEITTLVAMKLTQGNHSYTFDGKNLASGVYYYQLVAGDYREVKKMILLR